VLLLYVLIISIPWSVEYHFDANVSIDFPDEPLMILASIVVLILLIYRRKEIGYRRPHPLVIIIILQFFWTVITVITSTDILVSLKYSLAKGWYLMAFIGLPFFLFTNEKIIKRSVVLLTVSMVVCMFVTLARQAEDYWSFEKVNDALRPFFHNHVSYSALLVFIVPLEIAIIQLSRSHRMKVFISCLLIFTIVALYLSYSRGSWVALIIGIFCCLLLRKRMLLTGFLTFIFLIVGSILWLKQNDRFLNYSNDYKSTIFHPDFREHLIATYKLKDLSNAERINRWIAGVRMTPDYWKTGTGPTTFYEQYKSYTIPAFKTYVSDNKEHSTVHNYFLLLWIEQGVFGTLFFLTLIGTLFWYAQRIYFKTNNKFWKIAVGATASILVMQCVINFLSDMIETDKVGSIFYLCVVVLITADIKTRNERSNLSPNIQGIS
jgi:O-antigen ligase